MTVLIEGDQSFYITSKASLVDESRDVASEWASKYIYENPALKWVIGNYIEADNANSNGQQFALDDIRTNKPSLNHAPLNIDHQPHNIVGTLVASDLVYAMKGEANPHLEVVSAIWKYYFPETLRKIEEAHEMGSLFYSMESIGESVTCTGDAGCGETFKYAGPMSDTYCDHIKDRASAKLINNPQFLAAALILPPNRPGWKSAYINEMAQQVSNEEKDRVISEVATELPDATEEQWESIMWQLQMKRFETIS